MVIVAILLMVDIGVLAGWSIFDKRWVEIRNLTSGVS